MKKWTALLLALVLAMAIGGSASAEGLTFNGQAYAGNGTLGDASLTSATFKTTLTATQGEAVHLPSTTISYAISSANEVILTDAGSDENVRIFAGPGSGVTIRGATFSKDSTGSETVNTTIIFDRTQFAVPGIYRYQITPVLNDDQIELGIAPASEDFLYLDVYVTSQAGETVVSNAVLFKAANAVSYSSQDKSIDYTTANKIDEIVFDYPTYTVTITNNVTGGLGSKTQPFYFTVFITSNFVGPDKGITGAATSVDANIISAGSIEVNDDNTIGYWLPHGQTLTIAGIPLSTDVEFSEQYVNEEGYEISYSINGGDPIDDITCTVFSTTENDTISVVYTNHLDAVSPTGVVLRIAPYALMLGAGVVLFIILKAHKGKMQEET